MRADFAETVHNIQRWSGELGFQQVSITDADPGIHHQRLTRWLEKAHHGEMDWMDSRRDLRADPATLVPDALRVISLRMDYLSEGSDPAQLLTQPERAYISRYALGRDYHKLIRKRLAQLAQRIQDGIGYQYRAFVDSAPVLERGFAEKAGLGWIGKNTMLIHPRAGSWFFLGEIITDAPLPLATATIDQHCGSCKACIDICPTAAIVAPFEVDARRCISYLTIELEGPIPEQLRAPMGNRIFGCDDCQLVCPWNKFARKTAEPDFAPRHSLDDAALVDLFNWTEAEFEDRTAGSAIRRIGYVRWLRNIAVALGNALAATPDNAGIIAALNDRALHESELVREHVAWALSRAG